MGMGVVMDRSREAGENGEYWESSGASGGRRKGENKEEKGEDRHASALKPFDNNACNINHIPPKYQWPQEEVDIVVASK
jgi:hypothetical protein